ncbi:hypothetical protein CVT24_006984 [Panaeolus cyanescens]|uniref:Uncharacterized protein n=1 Tax=Panaeolus cyanescens TaxID=181874 RepID=A0A409W5F3_9AGAR|nr:hypothetical protein CVT24_006984 [Panaeolus cyanescens]
MPVDIHSIKSIHEWVSHYVEQTEAHLAESSFAGGIERRREMASVYLVDYIPHALDAKSARLKGSYTYGIVVGITTVSSAIFGGKLVAGALGGKTFRSKAMEEFGIDSDETVLSLIMQAGVDPGASENEDPILTEEVSDEAKEIAKTTLMFVWNEGGLKEAVHDVLIQEVGNELGDHLWHELVHLKPGIGTAISCALGARNTMKKLDAIINSTRKVALSVHTSIVVPIVLERLGLGQRARDTQASFLLAAFSI